MADTLGPDFSRWDGAINFEKLETSGAYFAFFKVGQGFYEDAQWSRSYTLARSKGMTFGGYWYYDNHVHPNAQARKLVELVAGRYLPLGLAIDFEDRTVGPYASWKYMAVMVQAVKDLLPSLRLLIYTSPSYWVEKGPSRLLNFASWRWFAQFPLWIAHYTLATAPTVPGPWSTWTFWQFTVKADPNKYGSQKLQVDLNRFNGDPAALDRYADNGGLPDPVPPAPVYKGTVVATQGVNVRSEPSIGATKISALPYGTALIGDKLQETSSYEKWLRLTSPVPQGWVAVEYAGDTLVALT